MNRESRKRDSVEPVRRGWSRRVRGIEKVPSVLERKLRVVDAHEQHRELVPVHRGTCRGKRREKRCSRATISCSRCSRLGWSAFKRAERFSQTGRPIKDARESRVALATRRDGLT